MALHHLTTLDIGSKAHWPRVVATDTNSVYGSGQCLAQGYLRGAQWPTVWSVLTSVSTRWSKRLSFLFLFWTSTFAMPHMQQQIYVPSHNPYVPSGMGIFPAPLVALNGATGSATHSHSPAHVRLSPI